MRVERSWISYDAYRAPEQGTLLFADIRAAVFRWLRISARMASYRTGSFDSRLYSYENDLRGVMSNIALFDTGIRAYMLLEIQASARIQLAVKYGVTVRDGVSELGEGADSIAGDRVGMVGAQWRVRY
jgi:hypothetical protein